MKPKSLYRSITFWSGILMMGFICWAWRDSMRYESGLSAGGYSAGNCAACVSLLRYDASLSDNKFARRSEHRFSEGMLLPATPSPLFLRGKDDPEFDPFSWWYEDGKTPTYQEEIAWAAQDWPRDAWTLMIPHWLLLLAVALPWSGLLLWRARRHRRARRIGASC